MPDARVALRPLPYPYRALLAICSDLDNTPDRGVYWEIMRYLNTTESTSLGPGVGLEVGNSIYFDMAPDEFAYWNTDDTGRAQVRALIRSGHIDCLHSYGDHATERRQAGVALDELARHACRIEVWVDHRIAPTNFGADIMRGSGDVPGRDAYHADLTCGFGVQYVWRGRVTSVIGQDTPRRLAGVVAARHPLRSVKTLAKETAKGLLARRGNDKYAMHATNDVVRPTHLRDGRPVHEFIRCNPYWGGVQNADTAAGLARTLTAKVLDRLVARGGVCVCYTHLGKGLQPGQSFDLDTRGAFERLAERQRRGEILVTTTRRLLGQRRAVRELSFTVASDGASLRIDVAGGKLAPADLEGTTFYVSDPERTRIFLDGRAAPRVLCNPPDHTGRRSLSLPWPALEFPRL